VYDPETAPTALLIDHIRARYHDTHRRELPDLLDLARDVETAHANDPNTPHGLSHALEVMISDLEEHMRREEELVFPSLRTGCAAEPIEAIRHEHHDQETALDRIAAITHGFRLPRYACPTWRRLYEGLGKLVEDFDEHIYLENEILFPRFEPRASSRLKEI
jgi:regulator of cell morphogenesis and NO signaling